MTCRLCSKPTSGKHQLCPELCRSRHKVTKATWPKDADGNPLPACACGKPMGKRAKSCQKCRETAKAQRRKARMHAGELQPPLNYPRGPEPVEPTWMVERKLAAVDAMKRRQRWRAA